MVWTIKFGIQTPITAVMLILDICIYMQLREEKQIDENTNTVNLDAAKSFKWFKFHQIFMS